MVLQAWRDEFPVQKGPVLSKKFRIGVGLPPMDETGHKIEVQIKFFLHD